MALARQQFEAMRNYSGDDDNDADSGPGQLPLGPMQDRRRLAEISYDYALDIIVAQRTALLDANDAGLFSPEGIGEALDILDADQLSLETRAISLN